MKRIFSLIAAALLAALTIVPTIANAEGGKVIFSMNSVDNVSPGESFTITLSISGEYEAHGMALSIEYDPNSMTLESCDQGAYLDGLRAKNGVPLLDSETLASEGKIKLGVMMPMDGATGSGDVLVMKFHVNEGVTVNQQVIMIIQEFIYMPLLDANGQPNMQGTDIPFSTRNSIITLNGGATPDTGYNEGDDGIGNNLSSSPSQAPDPTPGGSANTHAPHFTPAPGTTPAPNSARQTSEPDATHQVASESESPAPASPDESGEPTGAPEGSESADPNASGDPENMDKTEDTEKTEKKKGSALPYIIGAAAVGLAGGAAALVINRKKRG